MDTRPTLNPTESRMLVSHKDLQMAAKAVYDETASRMDGVESRLGKGIPVIVAKAVESAIRRRYADAAIDNSKMIESSVSDCVKQMSAEIVGKTAAALDAFKDVVHQEVEGLLDGFGKTLETETAALRGGVHAKSLEMAEAATEADEKTKSMIAELRQEMAVLRKELQERISGFVEIHRLSVESIQNTIKTLPPPQISVKGINLTPQFNVPVPQVIVQEKDINISPHFTMPEQKVTVKSVLEMPDRKTEKSVLYDGYGRVAQITEKTILGKNAPIATEDDSVAG